MVLWHSRIWICGRFFGCLRFFVAKEFMETCLFLVIGEDEGLPLRNNGCEQGKTMEDISKGPDEHFVYGMTCVQNFFFSPFLDYDSHAKIQEAPITDSFLI